MWNIYAVKYEAGTVGHSKRVQTAEPLSVIVKESIETFETKRFFRLGQLLRRPMHLLQKSTR